MENDIGYLRSFSLQDLNVSVCCIADGAGPFGDFLLAKIYGYLFICGWSALMRGVISSGGSGRCSGPWCGGGSGLGSPCLCRWPGGGLWAVSKVERTARTRTPRFPRFILLASFSDTLLMVSIIEIVYDCYLRPLLQS